MPASQLVLGVPAYGHGFSVNNTSAYGSNHKLNLYPTQNSTDRFQGSSWDTDPAIDDCGNPSPPGGTYPFWSLITEAKFLDVYGNPAPGISYTWDNCSQTVCYSSIFSVWMTNMMNSLLSTTLRRTFTLVTIMLVRSTQRVNSLLARVLVDLARTRLVVISTISSSTLFAQLLVCSNWKLLRSSCSYVCFSIDYLTQSYSLEDKIR
jgi:hypothetical protein